MSKTPKFRAAQVVMVHSGSSGDDYPVKLDHVTRIGYRDGIAWMCTLGNVEYEAEMRALRPREQGPRKGKRRAAIREAREGRKNGTATE